MNEYYLSVSYKNGFTNVCVLVCVRVVFKILIYYNWHNASLWDILFLEYKLMVFEAVIIFDDKAS